LEPFEVTGSRIKRIDLDGPQPLVRFTAAELAVSGQPSIGDFLRQLPWNTGYAPSQSNVTFLNAAQTGINLRGLGANNTLILLDGHRLPLFPQADGSSLWFDVGNLPVAAVEAVEILKDGASSLYGSDAAAGVINVRLKRSFRGARVTTTYRQFEKTDWSRRELGLVAGAARGGTSVLLAVDYAANNDVRFGDRPVSRSEDLRWAGGPDLRSNYAFPAHADLPAKTPGAPAAVQALPDSLAGQRVGLGRSVNGVVTASGPTRTLRVADFVAMGPAVVQGRPVAGDSRSAFERAPYTSFLPEEQTVGLMLNLNHRWSDRLEAFGETGWSRRRTTTTLHPTPVPMPTESASRVGDGPGGAIIFPASSPFNPFGIDLTNVPFSLVELGPRQRVFTNEVPRARLGLRGRLGRTWDWETGAAWTENEVREDTRNYITDADLQAGLSGGYINPFGASDPGVLDRARTSLYSAQRYRQTIADGRASGTLFSFARREVRSAIGLEARADSYRAQPSPQAATGAYVAWTGLARIATKRDVQSAFGELALPLAAGTEAQLALRAENYNDFGSTLLPKLAAVWRPARWLRLRAGTGRSFKAPELIELYADQVEIYSVVSLDPRRPDLGPYTVRYRTGGNPNLDPEKTNSQQAALAVNVPGVPGLQIEATQWWFRKRGVTSSLGGNFILANETNSVNSTAGRITRAAAGLDGRPGEIMIINDVRTNLDVVLSTGWDLEASWGRRLEGGRRVEIGATATLQETYRFVSRTGGTSEIAGTSGYPKWRGQARATFASAPWTLSANLDWIGHHRGDGVNYAGGSVTQHARGFTRVFVARELPRGLKASLGITNLFDVDPPMNFANPRGYNNGLYDNRGRGYVVQLAKEF
jgi:iron complex outermembrane receptor protein